MPRHAAQGSNEQLIARYVRQNPHVPGVEEAWVSERCVPVWALIAHWKLAGGDVWRTARAYALPCDAVEAAVAYYHRHQAAIDARIAANAA